MHFNFAASDNFNLDSLNNIEDFVNNYPDFQTVWLKDEDELSMLLDLMGLQEPNSFNLVNAAFPKYWDLSSSKFPELNNEQFDTFYDNWIQRSNRDTSMNEYGSLIFLQGLSPEWNKLKYRFVVEEYNNGT